MENIHLMGSGLTVFRITNTTPSAVFLAATNGFSASVSCLARSIGPIITGSIFHAGTETGYIGLPFWTLGAWATLGAVQVWWLRDYP